MSCSGIDLKAYALGELDQREARDAAAHARTCAECGAELERLQLTQRALLSLREEEPARRIAFVSDKVFEPSWWQRIWRPAPAMAFASALVLAGAILVHAWAMHPVVARQAPAVDTAAIEQRIEAKVNARVNDRIGAAVIQAVAEARRADQQKMTQLLAASEQKYEFQRKADLATFADNMEMLQKQNTRLYTASANIEDHP